MERLKHMKEALMAVVEGQMANLACADTEELGEAIDMIKDLEEAMYYCSITKAMEEKEKEGHNQNTVYYHERIKEPYYMDRDMDRDQNRMYYPRSGSEMSSTADSGNRRYTERPLAMRDRREGSSPERRRMYMESKELHNDKSVHMSELEAYAQELTSDIVEMVRDASPEEKQLLQRKLTALTKKIQEI